MKPDKEDICFSVESSDAPTDFLTPSTANIYEQPAEQSHVSTACMGITIVKMCTDTSWSVLFFLRGGHAFCFRLTSKIWLSSLHDRIWYALLQQCIPNSEGCQDFFQFLHLQNLVPNNPFQYILPFHLK